MSQCACDEVICLCTQARVQPWNEIEEEGVHFSTKLTELVNAGVRPRCNEGPGSAPDGYCSLMERCWTGRPELRPPFGEVRKDLDLMLGTISKSAMLETVM